MQLDPSAGSERDKEALLAALRDDWQVPGLNVTIGQPIATASITCCRARAPASR